MKRLLLGACALFIASEADAAWIQASGTTCGAANTIADLGNGLYGMPGLDQTQAFVTWGGGVPVHATNSSGVPLLFAVCSDPPSPTASCTVIRVEAHGTGSFGTRVTRPAHEQNVWVVADSTMLPSEPNNCGSYSLMVLDNGD